MSATPIIHTMVGLCTTCDTVGRRGYCAPGRCYCGHEACHAFASYIEPADLGAAAEPAVPTAASARSRSRSSWDDRDHDTWLDRL